MPRSKIPKRDRMDLAIAQEVEMTKDPALGIAPRERLLKAQAVAEALRRNPSPDNNINLNWTERGPNNIGGRVRALLLDANDPTYNTLWAGGVGGGLWKATTAKSIDPSWAPVNDFFDNLAVTAIAQDPSNMQVMYFGTGEGWYNFDAIRGLGIWRSANGGATWTHLPATQTSDFHYIQKIVVAANGHVFAATNTGLWRSSNGGASWNRVLGTGSSSAADVEIASDGQLYAAMGIAVRDGIYKSTNGGASWTKLTSGLPTSGYARIELACAPSNSNRIYALFENSATGNCRGIYRSSDAGATWTAVANPNDIYGDNFAGEQAWYNLTAAVDPNNADRVFIGGIDLFVSSNAGNSWTQISNSGGPLGNYKKIHVDQHAILFQPGSSKLAYVANDGGGAQLMNANNGTEIYFLNKQFNLNITQYYAADLHPAGGVNEFLAGSQDNGSHRWYPNAGTVVTTAVFGGDGGYCHIDQDQPNIQIASYIYNYYAITTNSWASYEEAVVNPSEGNFINPTDYDDINNILYCSYSNGKYMRISGIGGARTNTPFTVSLFNSAQVSAVKVSPNTPGKVFFGLDNGDVVRVDNANGGSPTAALIRGNGVGNVSSIDVEPGNDNHILITYSNYGVTSIWETGNGGATWTNVEGNLPDMPIRWVIFAPGNADQALVATELGVWTTEALDGAATVWMPSNNGLANVRTDMLRSRPSDRTIVAATHGRGLFTTVYPAPPSPVIALTQNTLAFGALGGTQSLSVIADAGWIYTGTNTWASASPSAAPGSQMVNITAAPNTGVSRGLGTAFRAGSTQATLLITQDAANLTVSPAAAYFNGAAGTRNLSVSSNINWSVSTPDNWISVGPASGTGNGTITVNVTQNPGASRMGTIVLTNGGTLTQIIPVLQNPLQQPPVVQSFAPATGQVNTIVTITGQNFNPSVSGNVVFFGAVRAAVNAAAVNALTVTVPVGATHQPITVLNTASGLTGASAKPFGVTFANGMIDANSYLPKVDFAAGSNPVAVAIADLDGDGKPDLIVANQNTNTISILRNTAIGGVLTAGSFAPKVDLPVGSTPSAVLAGDLDGDGKPDLVVANQYGNTISIFRNTATSGALNSGSFAPKQDFNFCTTPVSVSIGDLNGDGKADLTAATSQGATTCLLFNTSVIGTINFAPSAIQDGGLFRNTTEIIDLDRDGKPDVVVGTPANEICAFLNTSSNTIPGPTSLAFGGETCMQLSSVDLTAGDLDSDEKPDLATIDGSAVSIFRNISSPAALSFASGIPVLFGTGLTAVAIGDADGDGKPDLAASSAPANKVSVLRSTSSPGNLSFAAEVDFSAGVQPSSIAIGDLDGDGRPDLVTTNGAGNSVSVLRYNPCPVFTTAPPNVSITNIVCGGICAVPGVIAAPPATPCPARSILQYQVNGGGWSAELPAYNQNGPAQTIKTRCVCEADPQVVSPESAPLTTAPGPCPLPVVAITPAESSGVQANDGAICAGASATLATGSWTSYAWSSGETGAAISISPSVTTLYTVTVTDANGCTAAATATVTVHQPPVVTIAGETTVCLGVSASLTAAGGIEYVWSNNEAGPTISVTPPATATYTVTATNAQGCTASATASVTVNSLPPASIDGETTICQGQSTLLSATGGAAFSWNTGQTDAGITAMPSATTLYTVTVTGGNTCTATATATVVVHPLPDAIIGGVLSVCAGFSTTLTAGSGGDAYAWSTGESGGMITVSPSETQTYAVTATAGNGCTAEASAAVTVNALPAVAITGQTNICAGCSTTLTASGGGGYQWSNGGSSASTTETLTATTTFTVSVEDAGGCTAVASVTVTVDGGLPAAVQNPYMVKDVFSRCSKGVSSGPGYLSQANGSLFFMAYSGIEGIGLWKSDGTEAGTVLLKNGITDAEEFREVNGVLYFRANDGIHGLELWKSDGTPAGTAMIKDIWPGPDGSGPEAFSDLNGVLYFTAYTDDYGRELWKSDGTEAGTELVKDIVSGTDGSEASNMTVVNGVAYFAVNDGIHGDELWRSDGTGAGTVLLKDILPGTAGSGLWQFTGVNGMLFFSANDDVNGEELWKSDGTQAGTVLVKDIWPGIAASVLTNFTELNGELFFTADDGLHGRALWKSDGTEAGTILVKAISGQAAGLWLTSFDGALYFNAVDDNNVPGLWKSDGTENGTLPVLNGINILYGFTTLSGALYFTADDGAHGEELWKSDGTTAGTVLVRDIRAGSESSNPTGYTIVSGVLYFSADDGEHGMELWKSDGTESGTMLVGDLLMGSGSAEAGGVEVGAVAHVNGVFFFRADDGEHGTELWKSDGTEAGTVLVEDIAAGPGASNPRRLTNVNGILYFIADDGIHGVELWKSDGTPAGTVLVKDIVTGSGSSNPEYLTDVGGTLFFRASSNDGPELWKSDGTEAGTVLVKDNWSSSGEGLMNFTHINGILFFRGNDGVNGMELWKSDGTVAGTLLVKDIPGGSQGALAYSGACGSCLTEMNGVLYFVAADDAYGRELWKSDGTPAGTVQVKDIRNGIGGSDPVHLTNVQGTLYFSAFDGQDRELWKSDGTESGTVQVAEVASAPYGLQPTQLTNMNGKLFFVANDYIHGDELWSSDGTQAGTFQIKDISNGPNSSEPGNLTNVNGQLYFRANDGIHGGELWKSDGTETGTVLVKDIVAGQSYHGSSLQNLTNVNGKLYFSADFTESNFVYGREIWSLGNCSVLNGVQPELCGDWVAGAFNVEQQTMPVAATCYCDVFNNLITTVETSGANPVNGSVASRVWIDTEQPETFVERHYEITPENDPELATGRVTIYFTQSEFDAFNNQSPPPASLLPTGSSDAEGIANIRVQKIGGASNDGYGLPDSYTGADTLLNPNDGDVVWNAAEARWEISLNVTGFSGFWTMSACPVFPGAPPNVSIVNSVPAPGCMAAGGSIAAPTGTPCPERSILQYREDNGAWSTTLPLYKQTGPVQTIRTRCVCEEDPLRAGPESAALTTAPGFAPPVIDSLSVTQPGCILPTGAIVVHATGVAALEYSADNGANWQPAGAFNGLAQGAYTILARLPAEPVCSQTASAANPVVLAIQPDLTPPTVTCPDDITVCPESPNTTWTGVDLEPPAIGDNCSTVTLAHRPGNGIFVGGDANSHIFTIGVTAVSYRATDGVGLTVLCSFAVTVQDPNTVWYLDADLDGYYTGAGIVQCASPGPGYRFAGLYAGGDCNDGDPAVHPGAPEICNDLDDDCDGLSSQGCPTGFFGTIVWEHNRTSGIKDAIVTITGAGSGSDPTDVNGDFVLLTPYATGVFTLKPLKNLNRLNGVTAADAAAIQQHLTNINPITNPYKMIAADVNRSNGLSTIDATIINQCLLGNPAANNIFNVFWRFMPQTWTPVLPPWGFPEQINLTGVSTNQSGLDFYGVKIGDVTPGYANPANFGQGEPLVWRVQDRVLQAGETVEAEFRADQLDDVAAMQFALQFDPSVLQFDGVEPLGGLPLTMDHFGLFNVSEGEIRIVWAGEKSLPVPEAAAAFRLRFTVLEGGARLSEVLGLNDETLAGRVYNGALAESGVMLRFGAASGTIGDEPGAPGWALRAMPNPFSQQTTISFTLPETTEAQLRIVNPDGRELWRTDKTYPAGYHEETVRMEDLDASGLLFYELTTLRGKQTKKLVAVRL